MEHFRQIKNNLSWHNEGKFEAELTNGVITKLNFSEPGKGPADTGKSLTSTNFKYLQTVYNCLGDLFAFIDEENKRMGYSYASPISSPRYKFQNPDEVDYETPAEPKLRPIVNYETPPELLDSINDKMDNINAQKNGRDDMGLSA